MDKKRKSLNAGERLNSFRYAFKGLAQLVKKEHNFRIHLVITLLVVAAGILLNISAAEWLIITITIGIVLVAEGFNSAVERLCDIVSPREDKRIKTIKDILAAVVLISAIVAVIIGLVIFLPYFLALIL
ncbi:MAG: diacylglycerol kinase family protein [Bacteroidota bacterium]|nr:diacylglycerol kinase family protein [Bacteroidota bacterium]